MSVHLLSMYAVNMTLSSLSSSPLPTPSLLHCFHRIWDCLFRNRSVQQSVWDVWVYTLQPWLYIWWTVRGLMQLLYRHCWKAVHLFCLCMGESNCSFCL